MQISLSSPELLTFFFSHNLKIQDGGVLIVWYLCSMPNLVQIYVIVTEIDALCFWHSFDDVTRINFRFRLLVTWSSPHGRDASSHKIWYIYLYSVRSYWHFSEIQMAAAAILDFQFMWNWPFWHVGNVVFVFCTKFGSNICYSHWDRCTYPSDLIWWRHAI